MSVARVADPAWFEQVLSGVASAGLTEPTATLWEGGVRLAFRAAGAPVGLDVHALREGRAYATTASFTLYLRAQALPGRAEDVVRAAVAAIRGADGGGMVLPKGDELPEEVVAPDLRVGGREKSPAYVDATNDWLAVAATLPERLRAAACLAWGAHESGEAYPFVGALGPVADDGTEALRAWVLARYPGGFSREDFAVAWGPAAAEALMGVLAGLRAIGVADVGDAGVRFYPGAGGDVAVHAVLLWSEAVTAAARQAWGGRCDGGERARLDGAVGYVE